VDTDGGGQPDGTEVQVHATDPTLAADDFATAGDADVDGLSDWEEERLYGTDPFDTDSDDDGLLDGHEVLVLEIDPNDDDTDGDDLTDGEEALLRDTDPHRADTDRGGVPDGAEIDVGTDPREARDDYTLGLSRSGERQPGGGGARSEDAGGGERGGWWTLVLSWLRDAP
jgi:hypothetical protein